MLFFTGCVNTYNLTDSQIDAAYEKYSFWGVIKESDSGGIITGKVLGRGMLDLLTIGLFEIAVHEDKQTACYMYYLNTFIGQRKYDVIQVFGAPNRSCSDGLDGEILVYERIYFTGGDGYTQNGSYYSTPTRLHKDIKEFYFDAENKCYKLRLKTE